MKGFGQREVRIKLFGEWVDGREIILPLPPSENIRLEGSVVPYKAKDGRKHHSVRFHNSRTYNQWLDYARHALMKNKLPQYEEPVCVFTTVVFPDNRRRDNQNREKPLFDALTQSGCVYQDDCLIKQHFTREEVIKGKTFVLAYVVPYRLLKLDEFAVDLEYLEEVGQKANDEEWTPMRKD